tara:strand:+ start:3013 stop:4017 length:1005 start_codon:yes stop_codon:yes gene_type:complete
MLNFKQVTMAAAVGAIALTMTAMPATAKERLKMSTIAPGTSMYLVMTTMANLINQNQNDIEISVDATGAATKHMVDVGRGKIDMSMTSPTVHMLMSRGIAMYKKLKEAPKLAKNLRILFWFPLGPYHYVTYANSGIKTLKDIKGKKVFLGPPGGGQWATARTFLQGVTGYKVKSDYKNVKASFSAALQGFQDRQIDVYTIGCLDPCAQLQQLTATSKIRMLGTDIKDGRTIPGLKKYWIPGREWTSIAPDAYGKNQVNDTPVYVNGAVVGVTARASLPDATTYKMMKTFWPALEKIRANAPWTRDVTMKYATQKFAMPFHPGAAKYYKEIGAMK